MLYSLRIKFKNHLLNLIDINNTGSSQKSVGNKELVIRK